jgi:hypothetical protein
MPLVDDVTSKRVTLATALCVALLFVAACSSSDLNCDRASRQRLAAERSGVGAAAGGQARASPICAAIPASKHRTDSPAYRLQQARSHGAPSSLHRLRGDDGIDPSAFPVSCSYYACPVACPSAEQAADRAFHRARRNALFDRASIWGARDRARQLQRHRERCADSNRRDYLYTTFLIPQGVKRDLLSEQPVREHRFFYFCSSHVSLLLIKRACSGAHRCRDTAFSFLAWCKNIFIYPASTKSSFDSNVRYFFYDTPLASSSAQG